MFRENRLRRGIRLFDHPLLDWASRVHPVLPALFWGPLSVGGIAWGLWSGFPVELAVGLLAAGYLSWIVSEYFIHRWFFHFRPRATWLKRLFYYVHEHHHRYQEFDRLLAPPLLSLSLGAVSVGLFYVLIGRTMGFAAMCVFGGGFGIGYLIYDYTHLYIHFARPKSRWGRFLRRCHLEHHFARPDRWFCISLPWLDFVFRTNARPQDLSRHLEEPAPDDDALPCRVRDYEAEQRVDSASSLGL